MSDYISRADAIEAVAKLQKYDLDERNRLRIYAPWHNPKRIFVETEAIYKTIYTLPSADAVPFDIQLQSTREVLDQFAEDRVKVVRCKDCKWYKLTDNNDTEICTNKQWDISMAIYPIISAGGFCSYGERREK